ncbi:MAG: hypothetical protein J5382_01735 [Bacteroidales bacterium]|nr:hypothetical protein [Bacteroidales bacterium]
MVATISADIVNSTSLETRDLIELRKRLQSLFERIEADMLPGFWGRVVRGDTIECYVPDGGKALRIAIIIKLFVRMFADNVDCSYSTRQYGVRFSIGLGSLKYVDEKEDVMDGPAIYISGRYLDAISAEKDVFSAIGLESDSLGVHWLLESYVALIDNLVRSYSMKQAQVVFYKLLGYKERQISEILNIYQSAVNSRSSLAKWGLLETAIKDFEHLNFEGICG